MHVNDLGYDVLHRVFAILDSIHDLAIVEKESSDTFRKEAYRLVKALSSVSRSWRALTLPYRYKKLQFSYTGGRIKSTAKHIIGLGYSNIPQVIEISIKNTSIDKINLADKMSKVAIGQASWLQIRRVVIKDICDWTKIYDGSRLNAPETAQGTADFFSAHMPNVREIEFFRHKDSYIGIYGELNASLLLFPRLVNVYSNQLRSITLFPTFGRLLIESLLPQQLAHLDIDMGKHERRMVSGIFSPSLQSLKLRRVTPDITWGWFNKNDRPGFYFHKLKELDVEFVKDSHRQSYLNHDMAKVKPASYESDYQNVSKHVHFPVLEKLRIENYPYDDDGFYRLFDESPLRRISIEPHGKAQCRISHRMLPIAEDLFIQLNFDYQEFKRGGFKGDTNALRKSAYVDALASLVSCSSTVRTAHIALYLYDTASLPDTLSWGLMTNLELEMFIDMRSLFTVLLQMPKLQRLRFYMYESQVTAVAGEDSSASEQTITQHPQAVNSRIYHIAFIIFRQTSCSKASLRRLLTKLLPLAPSLLKLEVSSKLVDTAKEFLSTSAGCLERISEQLEVVPWTGTQTLIRILE